jgi:hypothetical protein
MGVTGEVAAPGGDETGWTVGLGCVSTSWWTAGWSGERPLLSDGGGTGGSDLGEHLLMDCWGREFWERHGSGDRVAAMVSWACEGQRFLSVMWWADI